MKGRVWCVWCVSPHPLVKTRKKLNGLIYSIVYARGKIRCCGGFMPALALFRDVPFCRLLVPHTGRQFLSRKGSFCFLPSSWNKQGTLVADRREVGRGKDRRLFGNAGDRFWWWMMSGTLASYVFILLLVVVKWWRWW